MRRNVIASLLVVMALGVAPAALAVEVKTASLGHGVEAWYVPNETVPVVDVVLSFEGAGSASDPEGKGGRATFAASMLTEGGGELNSAQFQKMLDEHAISMQVEAEEDRLKIHIYCLREEAKRAGELLAMALAKPRFEEADQARMKQAILSELRRMEEMPSYQAQRLLAQRVFQGHPYANPLYGSAQSVAGLNAGDLKAYLSTYVTRGNVLIAASGDVDDDLLEEMLEGVVEALPKNEAGAVEVTQTNLQGAGEVLHQKMPVPQTNILFVAPAIARNDPRFYAQYLLNQIIGGNSLMSRFGDALRRDKGFSYNVDTDLDMRRGSATLSGALATQNASAEAALGAVKTVLKDVHDKGVTTEECNDAKSYMIGSQNRMLDSSSRVSSLLITMQIYRLGKDYINEREALFSKVSCADINNVAEQLLDPARFVFAVVGGDAPAASAAPASPAPAPAPTRSDVR